ncbi:ABC transporter permease subunit [Elioraea sp. Yellowstone]|jgi:ABC-2 type transport system permease protein|uniref:ABC transporter permease subunit n=1 Tax=Elioraea sp. Yellowstone TaxID=2592070 RepID=UPI00114D5D60|nr:ABC transporter permease subunit [Elioraea sp. Yellowstone]TQF81478.1 ABC transporter permease subunit [Elioraea sp. Yellowstone]
MRTMLIVARRELAAYFATPVAYVFIVIFLVMLGALTFQVGNFFDRGQADLAPFFTFLPWLYLLLIPAITMRLWAEERRSGTIELLLTLPVAMWQAVVGKFLAAWAFAAIALALTFPMVITVNVLGTPDNGVILAGYAGALLIAGCYLSIGAALSATTRNQVIAFVLATAVCFAFTVFGSPLVAGFVAEAVPASVLDAAQRVSLISRYESITRGVIAVRDLVFFATFIGFWLYANAVIVDLRKAG